MNRGGFTLLEVLIAMAIIALVIVALLRMEISSIALAAQTSISFRALARACCELDELDRMNFKGELEKKSEPFKIRVSTDVKSYQGIPLEKLTLQVLYEENSYSELYLYNARGF